MTNAPFIVFLVHGTFARGAGWTKRGSVFCERLHAELKALDCDDVRFEVVEWSGGNSHKARRYGAVKLERAMRKSIKKYPQAHQFVVAHSHGGNIALRAIGRNEFFRDCRIGIVTLATPFLKFSKVRSSMITWPSLCVGFALSIWDFVVLLSGGALMMFFGLLYDLARSLPMVFQPQRRREGLLAVGMFAGIGALVLLSIWFAGLIMEHVGPTPGHWVGTLCALAISEEVCEPIGRWFNLILIAAGIVTIAGIGYLGARRELSWGRLREIVRLRRQIFRRYAYSQPEEQHQVPTLAMSSGLDEAIGLLYGVWFMHRWTGFIVRTFTVAVLSASIALAIFLLWQLNDWMAAPGHRAWFVAVLWDSGVELFIIIGALVIPLFVGIAAFLLSKLAGFSSIGLGLADPEHNLLWTVHAQRRAGLGAVEERVRIPLREILKGSSGLLFHSRLYTSPRAIRCVAEWMHHQQSA